VATDRRNTVPIARPLVRSAKIDRQLVKYSFIVHVIIINTAWHTRLLSLVINSIIINHLSKYNSSFLIVIIVLLLLFSLCLVAPVSYFVLIICY